MDPSIVSALSAILGSLVGGSATICNCLDYTEDVKQARVSRHRDSKARATLCRVYRRVLEVGH